MKTFRLGLDLGSPPLKSCVLTIGSFDALHLGHQKLVQKLVAEGVRLGAPSVLMSFDPHPRSVLAMASGKNNKLLAVISESEKNTILEGWRLDYHAICDFDSRLAQTSAVEFFEEIILERLNTQSLVVGHDFAFGKNREGSLELLSQLCRDHQIHLEICSPLVDNKGQVISSRRIRDLILEGKVEDVSKLTGRPFEIQGQVRAGQQIGRTIQVPTLNLSADLSLCLPLGVYVTQILIGSACFFAVTNCGVRPTVSEAGLVTVESHLLSLNTDLLELENYLLKQNGFIKVHFYKQLRQEKKFNNLEELKLQILKDVQLAEKYWKENFELFKNCQK